jgi:hypothetical protein
MPLKSRVGRNSTAIKKPNLQRGTVAFLKTDKKFAFYWIDSHNQPREITPLEAFKIFEADENESSSELIANHHDHINNAIKHFEKLEHNLVQSQIDPDALGGVAQNAKKFLAEIIKYPKLTEKQRENIKKIIMLINIGKYTNLPSDVDKLQKKKLKSLGAVILELDKIAERYSVDSSNVQKGEKRKVEKPVLIISESFI